MNLDTGAIVNATQLSNGFALIAIWMYLSDKEPVVTRAALNEFITGSAKHAGPRERTLAAVFLMNTTIIDDNPSARVMFIPIVSKKDAQYLGENDRKIFGTGDTLGIPTVTTDARFVNRAALKGVTFFPPPVVFPSMQYSGQ